MTAIRKKRCVFDIEANGFLRFVTKFWCSGIRDVDTGEEFWFLPHQLQEFLDKLDEYDVAAAHNGSGYDEYALEILARLEGITWKADIDKFVDTHVMSRVLNYSRFNNKDKQYKSYMKQREKDKALGIKLPKTIMPDSHSLGRWGIFFGDYKGDFTDFSQYSDEMFEYMKQDVRLGCKVYEYLYDELVEWIKEAGNMDIIRAIQIETDLNRVTAEQTLNGWLLDHEKLPEIVDKISERMDEISNEVNSKLGYMLRKTSGDKNSKFGEYVKDEYVIKNGNYTKWVNNWFGWGHDTGVKSKKLMGPFCRVSFEKAEIGNTEAVKDYLFKLGWVPDEYNGKWSDETESGKRPKWIVTSPKITLSSIEHLEGAGDINEFYTLRSRKSIIEGWAEHIDEGGRLHGDAFNIGTPTFRQTHSIIVNLPSASATLGKEVRSLFISEPNWQVVSADSAACQLRLLSHYMRDDEFLEELLSGDMHQKNANILTSSVRRLLKDTTALVSRDNAKPFKWRLWFGNCHRKLCEFRGTLYETILSEARRLKWTLINLSIAPQSLQRLTMNLTI